MNKFLIYLISVLITSISYAQTYNDTAPVDENDFLGKVVCVNSDEEMTVTFEITDHDHFWAPEKGGRITIEKKGEPSQITDMYVTLESFGGEGDMNSNFQFSSTLDATPQNHGYPSARLIHRPVKDTWISFVGLSAEKIVSFDSCELKPL